MKRDGVANIPARINRPKLNFFLWKIKLSNKFILILLSLNPSLDRASKSRIWIIERSLFIPPLKELIGIFTYLFFGLGSLIRVLNSFSVINPGNSIKPFSSSMLIARINWGAEFFLYHLFKGIIASSELIPVITIWI